MKIYDESDHLICDSELDSARYEELRQTGELIPKQIIKEHHEAVTAIKEETVNKPTTIYYTDGTSESIKDGDPHIVYDSDGNPQWHELENDTRHYFGMDVKPVVIKEGKVATPEWDEIEDILIYRPYTEEELKDRQHQVEMMDFLNNAPELYQDIMKVNEHNNETQNKIGDLQFQIDECNLALAETMDEMVSNKDIEYQKVQGATEYHTTQLEEMTLLLAEIVGME